MKKLVLLLIATAALSANAGQEGGGGGLGIGTEKGIYLYDFLEGGIEETAYYNSQISDEMGAAQYVQNTSAPVEVQSVIVKKLNEIYRISPEIAFNLLEAIKAYQWRYTLPKVRETNDRGYSPVQIFNKEIQIAYRDDQYKIVTIDREYFKRMPLNHQAGLYFHEINYALVIADIGKTYDGGYDASYRSRAFTSYLFHPNFKNQTLDSLVDFYNRTISKSSIANSNRDLTPLKKYLSYSNYIYTTSTEFSAKCSEFKKEAEQATIEAGFLFTQIKAAVSNFYTTNERSACAVQNYYFATNNFSYKVVIGNTSYSYPYSSNQYVNSEVFTIESHPTVKCDEKISLRKSIYDASKLANAVAVVKEIKSRHEKNFFNSCITDKNLKDAMTGIAMLTVTQ